MNSSLYIHIPFCKQKCNYCDFVSYAGKEELIESYVEALIQEINSPPLPPSLNKRGGGQDNTLAGGEFVTIFFGGGTPTLLEPKHFERILQNVGTTFMVVQDNRTGTSPVPTLEITIEANPGTLNIAKLKELKNLGINRLSLGAQSFDDNMLKMLGRIHTAKEIYEAYDNARKAGFDNINLDLIFALPNQMLEQWKDDLFQAIQLSPNHLSTYNLQIEENTPLWGMTNTNHPHLKYKLTPCLHQTNPPPLLIREGERGGELKRKELRKLSDEEELAMYEYVIETLPNYGLRHYEISNFAVPGFECKHNLNYWLNGNYIGIGAGAHSHWNGKRWANTESVEEYIGSGGVGRIGERQTSDVLRTTPDDSQDATDQRDTLIMGLRLLEGIPRSKFNGFEKEVEALIKDNLLEEANNHYRLTRRGLYLANEVFRQFV